uniref:INO80 complex subunit E n=1 Tax=Scleropages formosus TaxID=113540 RepID=A0A8C9S0K1_SCLFO
MTICVSSAALGHVGETHFSQCYQSFYKQMPPRGFSGDHLQQLCHNLGNGQSFASLYSASRDATVFSALCIGKGWRHKGSEGDHKVSSEQEDGDGKSQKEGAVGLPSLPLALLGDGVYTSTNTHTHIWDIMMLKFVHNKTLPWCHSMEGDLYVLTGKQHIAESEKGDELCLFWSALCCSVADEKRKHSFGVLRTADGGVKLLSVGALEEVLGVSDLFPGRCDESGGPGEDKSDMQAFFNTITAELSTDTQSHGLGPESTAADVQSTAKEPPTAAEEQTESILVSLISSSFSLLAVPFRPIVSTITHIPRQVSDVIQEDVGILSALPSDTFSVFYSIVSDATSGVMSAGGLLGAAGEQCISYVYCCTASLVDTLLNTFVEGVTGVGTLAGDGVGIFQGIAANAWSVSKFITGTAWEHSEGYLCAVFSELGSQMQGVGGGLGKLVMKGGRGVSNVVKIVGMVMAGSVDMVVQAMMEAFGKE